jgi:hypothetical protein
MPLLLGQLIIYKCPCMQDEATFVVRFRQPDEDVVSWMEEVVAPGLGRSHFSLSPRCTAGKTEYIKIPLLDESRGLGERPNVN